MEVRDEEQPLYARQLAEMFDDVNEATLRAWMRREVNPMPCRVYGESRRPHRKAFPRVVAAMLAFESKAGTYAEVEQAARRCAMGARP